MGPALCPCPREVLISQTVAFHIEGVLRTLPASSTALAASSQPGMGYGLLHSPLLTESFPGPCPVYGEETESPDGSGEELEERG